MVGELTGGESRLGARAGAALLLLLCSFPIFCCLPQPPASPLPLTAFIQRTIVPLFLLCPSCPHPHPPSTYRDAAMAEAPAQVLLGKRLLHPCLSALTSPGETWRTLHNTLLGLQASLSPCGIIFPSLKCSGELQLITAQACSPLCSKPHQCIPEGNHLYSSDP